MLSEMIKILLCSLRLCDVLSSVALLPSIFKKDRVVWQPRIPNGIGLKELLEKLEYADTMRKITNQ